ncbi:MAG: DUF5367 family protein [Cyanobacteria bacterium P01_A01_bin.84]
MAFFFLWGFLIWLVASLFMRFAGQTFLIPNNLSLMLLGFAAMFPWVVAITYPIYNWKHVIPSRRPLAAICMVLPGMCLDIFIISFFPIVYPNLSPNAVVAFCASLLLGNSLILLTGFLPQQQLTTNVTENVAVNVGLEHSSKS